MNHGRQKKLTNFTESFLMAGVWTPSAARRTSIKSFLDTEERILAFFLTEPPTSFILSSTFFWCFFTALNNCTTPLERPHNRTLNFRWKKIKQLGVRIATALTIRLWCQHFDSISRCIKITRCIASSIWNVTAQVSLSPSHFNTPSTTRASGGVWHDKRQKVAKHTVGISVYYKFYCL